MSAEIELLSIFKKELVNFLDELSSSYPEETDFLVFRIFINDQIPITLVMDYFVKHLLPLKKMVDEKDEKFFLEENVLFGINAQEETKNVRKVDKVNHFKKLWKSGKITENDKDVIWKWFAIFLVLANKYVKFKKPSDNDFKTV